MAQEKTLIMEQGIGYEINGKAIKHLHEEHLKRLINILEQACEYADQIDVDPMKIINEINNKKGGKT